MSRIKNELFNPLQEKAQALGYDSIEEAIADGWDSAEVMSLSVRKWKATGAERGYEL